MCALVGVPLAIRAVAAGRFAVAALVFAGVAAGVALRRAVAGEPTGTADERTEEQWAECMRALRVVNVPRLARRPDGSRGIRRSPASVTLDVLIPTAIEDTSDLDESAGRVVLRTVDAFVALWPRIKMELGAASLTQPPPPPPRPRWARVVLACSRCLGGPQPTEPRLNHLGDHLATVRIIELGGNRARVILAKDVSVKFRWVRFSAHLKFPVFAEPTPDAPCWSHSLDGWVPEAQRWWSPWEPPDDIAGELLPLDELEEWHPTIAPLPHPSWTGREWPYDWKLDLTDTTNDADWEAWRKALWPRSKPRPNPDFSPVSPENRPIYTSGEGSDPARQNASNPAPEMLSA